MKKYGIEEVDWKKVFSVFSHFPHISKAILFGSRVKGTHKPFSDVDIALVGEALSLTDLLQLKNERIKERKHERIRLKARPDIRWSRKWRNII